jgi:hypothetical protein
MEEDHLGKPLLQKKEYPNCPGCKCAYLQHPDAKLPFKEYLNLFCLVLASCRISLSLSLSPPSFSHARRVFFQWHHYKVISWELMILMAIVDDVCLI